MQYEKPEFVVLETACAAIQGTSKDGHYVEFDYQPTNPAYEADE